MSAHSSQLVADGEILYLGSEAVASCLDAAWPEAIAGVRKAYEAHLEGDVALPKSEYLKYDGRPSYDRIIPLLGYLGGSVQLSGLKQICSSTGNMSRGLPRASGLIILNEPVTNRPFCILEAARISATRTAAVTGLALQTLNPEGAAVIALLGCGALADVHLSMLSSQPRYAGVTLMVYDPVEARRSALVNKAAADGFAVKSCASAAEAVAAADIVIPMTTAELPHLSASMLRATWIYAAVSLLDADLDIYEAADIIIVDDLRQSIAEGRPLERLAQDSRLPEAKIVEIGQWLADGRVREQARIVFNPMGTVITDLALSALVLERAMTRSLGVRLSV